MNHTADEAEVARLAGQYGPITREHHELHVSAESIDWWQGLQAKGRRAEVILALARPGGRVLLHTKPFYPPGTYRLTSGGVKPGEPIEKAAYREGYEELGLDVRIERFLGVITYAIQHEDVVIPFTSYVFAIGGDGEPHPTDTHELISGYRAIPWSELPAVADELESLGPDWIDWGRFRAIGHRFVGRLVAR
ncbi:MAG: NUDIX hydrolase [Chloroflexi bacterium]|nr:NUDIX hydrolase [Chloroflexota bacterium]MBU1748432.1 NUDIX hydrolase [Chloroflexota bacterium]MBU1878274.1 NUDIX hydrolase [Chloroflexota bacterium]